MRTMADATAKLSQQINERRAHGMDCDVAHISLDVCEDGRTALMIMELTDGDNILAGFELPAPVDPTTTNSRAKCASASLNTAARSTCWALP